MEKNLKKRNFDKKKNFDKKIKKKVKSFLINESAKIVLKQKIKTTLGSFCYFAD